MFNKKTEVWSLSDFAARKEPSWIEGGLSKETKVLLVKAAAVGLVVHGVMGADVALANGFEGPVSKAFDQKIWPLLLDIGQPLSKTMMCIGIYKCIRNDVEGGWKMVYRAGIGLAALFLIDGAIAIIAGVGADLSNLPVNGNE